MSEFYSGYIASAYGFAGVVVAGLILRAILDYRAQKRLLADFERRGIYRRSRQRG